MNNAQRKVLICATIALAIIVLFPPFLRGKRYSGHRFFVAPPDGYGTIDFTALGLEALAAAAFTETLYLIAGGRRK